MFITDATIEDGYIEQTMSLLEDTAPIVRLRAVRHADGCLKPIVRDYNTCLAIAVGTISYINPIDCLRAARNMAISFIETALKGSNSP